MSFDINRLELVWPGKYDQEGSIISEPRVALPFQIVERVHETRATREARETRIATLFDVWDAQNEPSHSAEGFKNKLIWGENKIVMESLLDSFAGKISLIYIDPPFAVGTDFSMNVDIGEEALVKESSIVEEVAYRDTWGDGLTSYVSMIYSRLKLIKELLADDGSIVVHIDNRTSALIKMLMDEIFGENNFRNEIIWWYRNAGMKAKSGKFHSKHDNILVYSKSEKYIFNGYRENLREGDSGKRRAYKFDSVSKKPKPVYDEAGKPVYFTVDSILAGSVWDIPILQGGKEVVGYPTQKPEELLERIVTAYSNEGDLVADLFCGSGTTITVAEKLSRKWIGADLGRFAIHITRKRLLEIENCSPFEVLNLGNYERQYWSSLSFGEDLDEDGRISVLEYIAFILKLYGATAISGASYLHGKLKSAFVHVGSVSSPVTVNEIEKCIEETLALQGKELHVLGWEWEMGLIDTLTDFAKGKGVKLIALQIPREVMEEEAAKRGQIKFFELSYLECEIAKNKDGNYVCTLTDFMIPNSELVPVEVRKKVKKWSDYVDYWAVDWDFKNDTFMPKWFDYRTKQDRSLSLKTSPETIPNAGKYKVMVKVVDIFGNDTTKVLELQVK